MLEAYASGVNAWIALRGRFAAPEFLLLGAPEPWTPVDSLLWGKTMGLWLSLNWRTELSRQALAGQVPQRMIDALWPRPEAAPRPSRRRGLTPAPTISPTGRRAGWRRCCRTSPRPSRCRTPPPTNGRWTARTAPPARRCWPATRIWRSAFPASGTWRGSTRRTLTLAGATAPGVPFLVLGHNGAHRLDLHHHRRRHPGRVHRDAGRHRRVPDAGRPAALRHPPGNHQGPRPAGPTSDRARDPPRAGDQRSATAAAARSWRSAWPTCSPATWPRPGCSR